MTTNPTADQLAGMLADDRLTPLVVATATIDGTRVDIVECVMPVADGAPRRGYLFQAVTGDYTLRVAHFADADMLTGVPGYAYGGDLLSTSTKSPAAAMRNARRVLAARAIRATR